MAKAFKFNNNRRLIIINFLKEELNFASSEFLIKKKLGKNTWGTQRNFKLYSKLVEAHSDLGIFRFFVSLMVLFCFADQKCSFNDIIQYMIRRYLEIPVLYFLGYQSIK